MITTQFSDVLQRVGKIQKNIGIQTKYVAENGANRICHLQKYFNILINHEKISKNCKN